MHMGAPGPRGAQAPGVPACPAPRAPGNERGLQVRLHVCPLGLGREVWGRQDVAHQGEVDTCFPSETALL